MWPFKKKLDLWKVAVDRRLDAGEEAWETLRDEVLHRSPLDHGHPHNHPHSHILGEDVALDDHYHDIPEEHFEHDHKSAPLHEVDTISDTHFEGKVKCRNPGCGREYDVQADCHVGEGRSFSFICTECGKQSDYP